MVTDSQQLHKAQQTVTLSSDSSSHIIVFIGNVDSSIVYFSLRLETQSPFLYASVFWKVDKSINL